MSPSEQAAFRAGILHAADMALVTALTIEIRPDSRNIRQQAAIAALQGLAEALKAETGAVGANVEVGGIPPLGPPATFSSDSSNAPVHAEQPVASRDAALVAGYTGDPCPSCQSFTLKRSGTCLACDNCGSTTGCS